MSPRAVVVAVLALVVTASTAACNTSTQRAYVRGADGVVRVTRLNDDPTVTGTVVYDVDDDDEPAPYFDRTGLGSKPGVTYVKIDEWKPAASVQELEAKKAVKRRR
ncbi:MAG: hypothetical protein JWP87_5445 [Labilithrix sp.]|nr:hypothetical protein [Labilithrix sp.]